MTTLLVQGSSGPWYGSSYFVPVDQKLLVLFLVWLMELVFADRLLLGFVFVAGVALVVELHVELILGG